MFRIKKKQIFFLVVSFSVFVLQWLSCRRFSSTSGHKEKPFLYLIQTEHCLPTYLMQRKRLGNSSDCKCDVLVLSFKEKCEQETADHIQYMYDPKTTWASGRNALYQRAWKRKANYRYYIFADDDILLEYNSQVNQSVKHQPELRTFENFLLEVEPAVGCVDYEFHHPASLIRTVRKNCLNKLDLSLLPMVGFDPLLNAFHRDALPHLLPYPVEYEKESWWYSHSIVSISIEFKFRGQAVMYPGITVFNTLHRPYPKNMTHDKDVFRTALDRKISQIPERFRNHYAVTSYRNSECHSFGYCHTTCMDIIPHRPIIPYDHFNEYQLIGYKGLSDFFNVTALRSDLNYYYTYVWKR